MSWREFKTLAVGLSPDCAALRAMQTIRPREGADEFWAQMARMQ